MSNRFSTYQKYLRSSHWHSLRKQKIAQTPACVSCSSQLLLHVHHRNYKKLYDCELTDLVVLCDRCHGDFHDAIALQRGKLEDYGTLEICALVSWYRCLTVTEIEAIIKEHGLKKWHVKSNRRKQIRAFQRTAREAIEKVKQRGFSIQAMEFTIAELQRLIGARKQLGL